jgi:hypothetical protein
VKRAPGIASWLLSRFGCSSNNEAVLGDLAEHYQDNHSRSWFWRQVLIALVTGFRTELSLHRLDATKAVLLGWFVLSLSSLLMLSFFTILLQSHRVGAWVYQTYAALAVFLALTVMLGCVATYVCGRLLARIFRPRHRVPLLLFAGSIVVALVVSVVTEPGTTEPRVVVNGIFSTTVTVWISPRVWIYAMGNPLGLLSLLTGGRFFGRTAHRDVIRDF